MALLMSFIPPFYYRRDCVVSCRKRGPERWRGLLLLRVPESWFSTSDGEPAAASVDGRGGRAGGSIGDGSESEPLRRISRALPIVARALVSLVINSGRFELAVSSRTVAHIHCDELAARFSLKWAASYGYRVTESSAAGRGAVRVESRPPVRALALLARRAVP